MSAKLDNTIEIFRSYIFDQWIKRLRDKRAVARINARLRQVSNGNIGDIKSVGDGVSEMRIFYGPGYRIYFVQDGKSVIVLLCGGDKSKQSRDIKRAKEIADQWRNR